MARVTIKKHTQPGVEPRWIVRTDTGASYNQKHFTSEARARRAAADIQAQHQRKAQAVKARQEG